MRTLAAAARCPADARSVNEANPGPNPRACAATAVSKARTPIGAASFCDGKQGRIKSNQIKTKQNKANAFIAHDENQPTQPGWMA
jgi:hypothetical protein